MDRPSEQTITITKAGPAGAEIQDLTIRIQGAPINPVGDSWEEEYRRFYAGEADILADALLRHLPGGTLCRLLVRLLEYKASVFRVPFLQPGESARRRLAPGTRGWKRAWAEIANRYGDVECRHDGETWQYMGTSDRNGEIVHEFRHRSLPPAGLRVYAYVTLTKGDFEADL